MYSDCVQCPKLGVTCKGPQFSDMTPQEVLSWCKARKQFRRLTNAKLAEMSGTSQGTIDSLFANSHADFKFGTIRPIIQALIGGDWQGEHCADSSSTVVSELKEKIRQLEAERQYKDKTIADHEAQIASMQTLITNTNARNAKQTEELRTMLKAQNERHAESQNFLREQIRGRNKAVAVLSFFLGVCLLVIIGALVIDRFNPDIGFFWLDEFASWLNTSSAIRGNA